MKFTDLFLVILIILCFVGMYFFSFFAIGLKNIRDNWPIYRCNPLIMPFASYFGPKGTNAGQNFSACIQTQTKGVMGDMMQPAHYSSHLGNLLGGGLTTAFQDMRKSFSYVRDMVESIVKKIFGVFLNILIEFVHMLINLKDLAAKIMGSMAVVLYMIDGMVKTGNGIWAGPVGDVIRFLCFHPETPVSLYNGEVKPMNKVVIGDRLANNSIVLGTLILKGSSVNPFYSIYSSKLKQDILVTGSHLVKDPVSGNFIPVSNLPQAEKTRIFSDKMSCLITDNHQIPIGEHVFWDWED